MIFFFIFIFYWLGISFRYALIPLGIVSLILLIIVFKRYKKKIAILGSLIFLVGIGVSFIKIEHNTQEIKGFVIESHESYFILNNWGEKLYVSYKENPYEIGDYLFTKGKKKELDFIVLESEFDFKNYLNQKGVYYEWECSSIHPILHFPIRIQNYREKFLAHFASEQQSLIKALLFSQRDGSSDLYNIEKLHISRLASMSGIFIYAYIRFFMFILSYLSKNKKLSIIPLITLIPYFIFTFPRFTVIRILVLETIRYINNNFIKHKLQPLEITGIVGLAFLLIDYHLGYQTSFILGFSFPIIISFIRDVSIRYLGYKKKLVEGTYLYLLAFPFEIKFYNGFNPLSPFLILVLSPVFIFSAFICLIGFYGVPIYPFITIVIKLLSNTLTFFSQFAFQINVPEFNDILLVAYFFLLLIVLYYGTVNFPPLTKLFQGILFTFIVIYSLPIRNTLISEVCFINVGQGDSCLIRKGNTAIMIDTGGLQYKDLAKETLIPFLQKKRIYNIDLVITTHDDYDHSGALDSLIENFYVKNVVTEATNFPININGISLANYNLYAQGAGEENEKSLVVGFTLNHTSYLITGDADKGIENKIMRDNKSIPCDVLKVGHHGSNTSTSDDWIKYLKPKEAVISVGRNNRYGHPHKEVINTLLRNHIKIRRTDLEGTITYSSYIFM